MEAFTALVEKLESLPESTNPYSYLADSLTAQILPNPGRSTINQMYFIAAVLAL
jgi:hypothetical protein